MSAIASTLHAANLLLQEGFSSRDLAQAGWQRDSTVHLLPKGVCIHAAHNANNAVLAFSNGALISFAHHQDCSEEVWLEDVNGDWSDLIGHPLLVADVREQKTDKHGESTTWTFVTLRGIGGSVDLRWCGHSNGYYSETPSAQSWTPSTPITISMHTMLAHAAQAKKDTP